MRTYGLLMPAATLAGALALAGCGGGGGASQEMKTDQEKCEDGGGTWNAENETCTPAPPAQTAAARANALMTATDALATLAGGASDEGSALKRAMDHDEAADDTVKAEGVSERIRARAQGVLDAREALRDAVAKAKTEKGEAMTALAGATGADKELLEREIADADKAIKAGEARLKARGLKSLQGLAARYEGKGNTPAEKAGTVAEELHKLTHGTRRALDGTPLTSDTKNVFARGNTRPASAMKFAEIFSGETKKIAVGDKTHDAVSLKGVESGDGEDFGVKLTTSGTVTGSYLGIPGTAYCRADECKDDGEGWYFVPTKKDDYFVQKGAKYEPAKFVEWAMWLTENDGGDIIVNRHVGQGVGSGPLRIAPTGNYDLTTVNDKLAKEATYTGAAAGLSAREHETDGSKTYHSGHFTADVSLTAKFAATPTLEGRISGFKAVEGQGTGHVNPNWRLDLKSGTQFTDGKFADGTFDRSSVKGSWTAQMYDSSTDGSVRPDGVYGAFNADFSDGKASGVYHAD